MAGYALLVPGLALVTSGVDAGVEVGDRAGDIIDGGKAGVEAELGAA